MAGAPNPSGYCAICGEEIGPKTPKIGQDGLRVHFNCYEGLTSLPKLAQSLERPSTDALAAAEPGKESRAGLHYHIRWAGKDTLDWERFNKPSAAEESAQRLARPNERYTIEEQGEACPRCVNFRNIAATAS